MALVFDPSTGGYSVAGHPRSLYPRKNILTSQGWDQMALSDYEPIIDPTTGEPIRDHYGNPQYKQVRDTGTAITGRFPVVGSSYATDEYANLSRSPGFLSDLWRKLQGASSGIGSELKADLYGPPVKSAPPAWPIDLGIGGQPATMADYFAALKAQDQPIPFAGGGMVDKLEALKAQEVSGVTAKMKKIEDVKNLEARVKAAKAALQDNLKQAYYRKVLEQRFPGIKLDGVPLNTGWDIEKALGLPAEQLVGMTKETGLRSALSEALRLRNLAPAEPGKLSDQVLDPRLKALIEAENIPRMDAAGNDPSRADLALLLEHGIADEEDLLAFPKARAAWKRMKAKQAEDIEFNKRLAAQGGVVEDPRLFDNPHTVYGPGGPIPVAPREIEQIPQWLHDAAHPKPTADQVGDAKEVVREQQEYNRDIRRLLAGSAKMEGWDPVSAPYHVVQQRLTGAKKGDKFPGGVVYNPEHLQGILDNRAIIAAHALNVPERRFTPHMPVLDWWMNPRTQESNFQNPDWQNDYPRNITLPDGRIVQTAYTGEEVLADINRQIASPYGFEKAGVRDLTPGQMQAIYDQKNPLETAELELKQHAYDSQMGIKNAGLQAYGIRDPELALREGGYIPSLKHYAKKDKSGRYINSYRTNVEARNAAKNNILFNQALLDTEIGRTIQPFWAERNQMLKVDANRPEWWGNTLSQSGTNYDYAIRPTPIDVEKQKATRQLFDLYRYGGQGQTAYHDPLGVYNKAGGRPAFSSTGLLKPGSSVLDASTYSLGSDRLGVAYPQSAFSSAGLANAVETVPSTWAPDGRYTPTDPAWMGLESYRPSRAIRTQAPSILDQFQGMTRIKDQLSRAPGPIAPVVLQQLLPEVRQGPASTLIPGRALAELGINRVTARNTEDPWAVVRRAGKYKRTPFPLGAEDLSTPATRAYAENAMFQSTKPFYPSVMDRSAKSLLPQLRPLESGREAYLRLQEKNADDIARYGVATSPMFNAQEYVDSHYGGFRPEEKAAIAASMNESALDATLGDSASKAQRMARNLGDALGLQARADIGWDPALKTWQGVQGKKVYDVGSTQRAQLRIQGLQEELADPANQLQRKLSPQFDSMMRQKEETIASLGAFIAPKTALPPYSSVPANRPVLRQMFAEAANTGIGPEFRQFDARGLDQQQKVSELLDVVIANEELKTGRPTLIPPVEPIRMLEESERLPWQSTKKMWTSGSNARGLSSVQPKLASHLMEKGLPGILALAYDTKQPVFQTPSLAFGDRGIKLAGERDALISPEDVTELYRETLPEGHAKYEGMNWRSGAPVQFEPAGRYSAPNERDLIVPEKMMVAERDPQIQKARDYLTAHGRRWTFGEESPREAGVIGKMQAGNLGALEMVEEAKNLNIQDSMLRSLHGGSYGFTPSPLLKQFVSDNQSEIQAANERRQARKQEAIISAAQPEKFGVVTPAFSDDYLGSRLTGKSTATSQILNDALEAQRTTVAKIERPDFYIDPGETRQIGFVDQERNFVEPGRTNLEMAQVQEVREPRVRLTSPSDPSDLRARAAALLEKKAARSQSTYQPDLGRDVRIQRPTTDVAEDLLSTIRRTYRR